MDRTKQGFSVGWIFVAYFMIAGGFIIAASLAALLKLQSAAAAYVVYFLGAGFGGFFAGRASPGKTIIEPAVGGVLLVASFVGLIVLVPGVRDIWSIAGEEAQKEVLLRAMLVGGLTGAGGLVGAALGERTQPPTSESALRWIGISALVTLGMLFFLFAVLAILMLRHAAAGGSLTDDQGFGVVFLALVGSALFGGFITQSIAPRRMCFASGSGFVVVLLVMLGVGVSQSEGSIQGNAITGMAIIALGGILVGALGALIGWALIGKRRAAAHQPAQVARTFE